MRSQWGPNKVLGVLKGHTAEVCGLKWSPQGTMLASGGNDNLLSIWDNRYVSTNSHTTDQPLFRLDAHKVCACIICCCRMHVTR